MAAARSFRQLTNFTNLYTSLRSKVAIPFRFNYQDCVYIHTIFTLNARGFGVSTTASKNWNPSLEDDDDDHNDEFRSLKRKAARKHASKFTAAQKGTTKLVRPSRYQINEVGDTSNDDGFWMKRSRGSLTTKQKLEWYTKQILKLMSENKVDQAQELFESMRTKKIKPSVELFNILIAGYGRIGKIQKAFNHYNNIKKMGLQPTARTYSSLFNICSSITPKNAALSQLMKLWEEFQNKLESKIVKPDIITYNAALKAAASCHSFTIAMEMYSNLCSAGIHPESRTYSSLLSACAEQYDSDNVQWILKEMKSHNINPDIYIFNAVLKALRSKGSEKYMEDISDTEMPGEYNMLDVLPGETQTSSVFAGVEDFLQMMAVNDVIPDIRTFHLLLQVSDPGKSEEDYVLQVMKFWDFKPDLPVLNALVKRRAFWGDISWAKEYIKVFKEEYGVAADENIYHSLAKGCRRMADGMWLLEEMKVQGYPPGVNVYLKLIKNAIHRNAFQYLTELLKKMRKDGVKPSEEIIQLLNEVSRPLLEKDSNNEDDSREIKKREFLRKQKLGFLGFYKAWKDQLDLKEAATVTHQHTQDTLDEKDNNDFKHL